MWPSHVSLVEDSTRSGDEPDSSSKPVAATEWTRKWNSVQFLSRSPGSRVFPSAVVFHDSLFIFGGHDGSVYRNDLLVFNMETRSWQADLDVRGDGPSPRDAHAAVVHKEWMYVFGGYDSKRYLADFHRFHLEECAWSVVRCIGSAPTPRGGHTAVVHRDRMLVFGGCDGWNYFNDCFTFDFIAAEWAPVRVTGTAPGPRSAPASVIHEGQGAMYVFGGYDGARSLNDLFRFDLASSQWSQVRVTGQPPSPRGGHTAVVYGDTLYAFGGKSGRSPFNDLCSFEFERGSWEHVQVGNTAPAPRCAHVCVVHADSLLVFGGYDGRHYFDDCFEFCFERQAAAASSVFSLAGDLEGMLDNEQFSDICFIVEGRSVHAHKNILFARCEYFRRMFTSGYKESSESSIKIEDVTYDVFLCVLSYLYTGKPRELTPEIAVEAMGVANLYNIEPLKRMCADIVSRGLCIENVASLLQAADSYNVQQLRSSCIQFMVHNFAAVVRTDAFRDLLRTESAPLVLAFLEEASCRLIPADNRLHRSQHF